MFSSKIIDSLLPNIWSKYTDVQKIELLQSIENIMANMQNRPSRKVIKQNLSSKGEYSFNEPTIIKISDLEDGVNSAITIIHEGIHAMYHDATLGKIKSVTTFYDTKESIIKEDITNRDIIYNYFSKNNMIDIFATQNVEDRIAHYDSCMFLLFAILFTPNINQDIINYYTRCVLASLVNYYRTCDYYKKLYNVDYMNELNNIDYEIYNNKKLSVSDFNIIKNSFIINVQKIISDTLYSHETMPKGYTIGYDDLSTSKRKK